MAADAELIFRSSADGSLTADETTDYKDMGGPSPLDGIPFRLTVPTDSSGDTLDVILKDCATSGGSYVERGRFAAGEIAGDGVYRKRFTWVDRFIKWEFDVTDGGGGVDFGAVDLRAETAGSYNNAARDI